MESFKLTELIHQSRYLLPEMILVAGGLLILLVELFNSARKTVAVKVIFIISLLSSFTSSLIFSIPFNRFIPALVWDVLMIDHASLFFFLIFTLTALLLLFSYWKQTTAVELFLVILMVFGALVVVKAVNLLVLLLAVEVLSIGAYCMAAIQQTPAAREASIKYIIFGGVSTAIFLFGISLLFGLTNTLSINSEIFTQSLITQDPILLMVILVFIFAGLFFKITAFPFHLWAPDIYEAVPAPIASFFSVLPKIAVLGFMIKFSLAINLFNIIDVPWQLFLAIIAMITMTLGNLAALFQKSAKRMMAYSSIAHTGFFLMALVAFNDFAFQSLIFYAIIYLLMNFTIFLFIHFHEIKSKIIEISGYSGFAKSFPFQAVVIVIGMIALTGLPPTAGFTSKLFVFTAVWEAYQETSSSIYWVLLIVGILNSVISLFFYLKIPYFMIFKERKEPLPKYMAAPASLNFLFVILVLPLLILFIRPDILMDWINMITFVL